MNTCDGVWLSLVERYVRDVEAASSNLVTPIEVLESLFEGALVLFLFKNLSDKTMRNCC